MHTEAVHTYDTVCCVCIGDDCDVKLRFITSEEDSQRNEDDNYHDATSLRDAENGTV